MVGFNAGAVIDNRYEILEHLGSGGIGTVYRAEDLKAGLVKGTYRGAIGNAGFGTLSSDEVQALAGDSTDNIPGVPGIGIKTAAQLIGEYGDLDDLLANAGEIKQNKRRENMIEFADLKDEDRLMIDEIESKKDQRG